MIYSVTLNPSIDFIVRVKDFQLGETNRAYEDNFFAGGKGIMVSKLLKNVLKDGYRTSDIYTDGYKKVGTIEMGEEIINKIVRY